MELELITDMGPEAWDEAIKAFDSKCLFHQSVWLRFLEETQGAKTLRFKITDKGKTDGYFVGLVVRKGPLKILGSPLPGWTTDYMGPVVDKGFDSEMFLDTLDEKCRNLGIHHIEMCNTVLPPDLMLAKGYVVEDYCTFTAPLFEDEKLMWDNLHSKCRYNIRKAYSNGLRVEACDAPAIVDEYYSELVDVFARQRLVPSYPVERVRSLFELLSPGSITALCVKHGDKVIASGLFPYDDRSVYLFGAASWKKYQGLFPNELLYWTAMTISAKKGILQFDMCGDGSFKHKFGAKMIPVHKYSKSYSFAARWGREAYRAAFRAKQSLNGRFRFQAGA